MAIQGFDHVNIHTSERRETIWFYTELLDFTEGFRPPFNFPGAWLYSGEKAVIHLVYRNDAPKGVENPVDHVAFEATGYDDTRDRLKQANWNYRCADVPDTLIRQIFLEDPNGVRLELNFRK
mgnify:FL=1